MSVHYKFKSALEYDTVTFDGLHISVKDLKNAIIQQKRIGKSTDFDLQVTNAQTKEVYEDENTLIPKNASLLIARIPVVPQKNKSWDGYGGDNTPPTKLDEGGPIAKEVDLSSLDAPEDDKIKAMMSQSTQDYDPSNYMKIRGANQVGVVPPNYKCYKCHQSGHWIKDCTFGLGTDQGEIKKSTGIPRSFMVAVDGPQVPGAMMTPNGQFAVPLVDHQAYNLKPVPMPVQPPKMDIPEELVCSICADLLTDAVMIPCCGNSFCDECIRGVLLESEDHECPDCHEKEIFPDTLIPNRFLRTSVANFKNTTGYVKIPVYREPKPVPTKVPNKKEGTPPKLEDANKTDADSERQTIISEADSTEPHKNNPNTGSLRSDQPTTEEERMEGPPGVSPKGSPRENRKYRDHSPGSPRDRPARSRRRSLSRSRSISPRRSPRRVRSRSRSCSPSKSKGSGTPTVDEPLTTNYPPSTYDNTSMPPVGPIQGPPVPGSYPIGQPPIGNFPGQGPNYRFPPPGTGPPFIPGPYNVPRGMFDGSRPPIGSHFQNFPPGSRGHRDFNRRMLDRAPPGVIDDPLAAFNRLLREKDEQKRRAKQRGFRRSYSRSRSRSRSFSRSPVRRRSRSPRALRRSRSRSRSFSLSRSRSRSYSGSPHRQLSPARRSPSSVPLRRGSRYRSPVRSPPRSRNRDRDFDDDRDYDRADRRDSRRNRDRRSSRERDRYYDNFDDKKGVVKGQWNPQRGVPDNFYPGPPSMQPGYQTNRFGQPREFGPPFMNKESPFNHPLPQTIHSIQPQRQYQDIAPPGVDDDIAPPGVEEPPYHAEKKEINKKDEKLERRKAPTDRKRGRHEKRSRTPEKIRSPKRRSKSKEKDSPDKHRRRRRDSSDKEDDEKSKRNKDKKKHKEKKESEKKKKRDKKEKHKKEIKEKKAKEEFKQVIPKNIDKDEEDEKDRVEKKRLEREHKKEGKHVERKVSKSPPAEEVEEYEEEAEESEKEVLVTKEDIDETNQPDEKVDKAYDIDAQPLDEDELIEEIVEPPKADLYGDVLTEIDKNVIQNYGKFECDSPFDGRDEGNKPAPDADLAELTEDGEIKDFEDEEKDVLELHTSDMDLKTEVEKPDILAPVPEISKWEVEDDGALSPKDSYTSDANADKNGKVTNEVLKRAENAIFAKAINAIRPIEIKKIGSERAKLYSGDKETVESTVVAVKTEANKPPRVSVKDRLGIKVEDSDKIINLSRRSNTVSPFSRRGESGRNITLGERRVEVNDHKRNRRSRSRRRSKERPRSKHDNRTFNRTDRRTERSRRDKNKKDDKSKNEDEKKVKRKRSRTTSESEEKKDKHKKKDKKVKKDKLKKKDDEEMKTEEKDESKTAVAAAKRKATIDEASFEPDYDESHSDNEDDKPKKKSKKDSEDSSSSETESSSSSEEERRRKKRKKHRKKKKKETSSSSSSSSEESDSSDSDRDRKRKKHKKNKKKKKKAKHK